MIEGTDWGELEHAYGPAENTPLRPVQLLDEDPEVQSWALTMLGMSVLHQDSLYSATAPAALYVAGVLDDTRTLTVHENNSVLADHPWPLRAALLECLGRIADSAAYGETTDEDGGDDQVATDAARTVCAPGLDVVLPHLLALEPAVREAALGAVAMFLQSPDLTGRTGTATRLLSRLLAESTDRRERAAIVLTIGFWGHHTTSSLTDPDPAVRACAALTPALADNPDATRVMLDALGEPTTVDSWFSGPTSIDPWDGRPLPHIEGRLRHALLTAAIDRVTSFEELLPTATAFAPLCSNLTIADDWGPLLAAAFPRKHHPGAELTPAQHTYLSALVERDVCWRCTHLIASWFEDVGLPPDREAVRALLSGP
ncbi:HEAT repeat domain-containing protein [Streptomyces sp. t39]|uniref:HEAT repeat domain-containing protein n=1 Tax=Streptomyces sp. t39 TaxID=1828156 RepID=UPI0011CDA5B0|nr:HEAT repeat domain-containing protein [Streptomyces sp. t39]TXS52785.1 HEAT repeat domain-containing protein [Streptomyces sp. t39]